jgi:hypothetical protein
MTLESRKTMRLGRLGRFGAIGVLIALCAGMTGCGLAAAPCRVASAACANVIDP